MCTLPSMMQDFMPIEQCIPKSLMGEEENTLLKVDQASNNFFMASP